MQVQLTTLCAHCGRQQQAHRLKGNKLACQQLGEDMRYAGLYFRPVGKPHLRKTGPRTWKCYVGQGIAREARTPRLAFDAALFAFKQWSAPASPTKQPWRNTPRPARHPAFLRDAYFDEVDLAMCPEKGR